MVETGLHGSYSFADTGWRHACPRMWLRSLRVNRTPRSSPRRPHTKHAPSSCVRVGYSSVVCTGTINLRRNGRFFTKLVSFRCHSWCAEGLSVAFGTAPRVVPGERGKSYPSRPDLVSIALDPCCQILASWVRVRECYKSAP